MQAMQLLFIIAITASLFRPFQLKMQKKEIDALTSKFESDFKMVTELNTLNSEPAKQIVAVEMNAIRRQFEHDVNASRPDSVKVLKNVISQLQNSIDHLDLVSSKISRRVLDPYIRERNLAKTRLADKIKEIEEIENRKFIVATQSNNE